MNDDFQQEKKQKIDILNEELYYKNKNFDNRKRRVIHDRNIHLEHNFQDEALEKKIKSVKKRKLPKSFFKKIFIFSAFFFLVAALIAALSLYEGKKKISDDLISMEILGQPFVDGGETLELYVRIQNFNEQELELPDLVLSYKKDVNSDDEVFKRRSLENIKHGQKVNEKFEITLFGQEGDVRDIKATLEYRVKGSSSIFVKEVSHSVIIRSSPTILSVDAPKQIVQNQEIELHIQLASNTNKQINNILFNIEYPLGFEFISSNIPPKFGNHIWFFKNLTEEKKEIVIKGKLSALPHQGQSFHSYLGKQDSLVKSEMETIFNSITTTVEVQEPFISANLDINRKGSENISLKGGDDADVTIAYKNMTDDDLSDVSIVVHLDGNLYDPQGVRVQSGDFDSNMNQIVWNKGNYERFKNVSPGEEGELSFTVKTKELVGALGALKNPELKISVDVFATGRNGKRNEAFSVAQAKVFANSDLKIIAKTLYKDGPFKNSGPIPPRVGSKTQYTLTFQITNTSNEIDDAKLKTFLPPYVKWLNRIAPSVEREALQFNEHTRELIWDLGKLKSGLGIGTARPRQVSFQVEASPSLSFVDDNLPLTKELILSGVDTFTGTQLSYKKKALDTRIADQGASSSSGHVVK